MADTVELYCQAGEHRWNRPKQRGKRPKNCPDHAPVATESAPKRPRITFGSTKSLAPTVKPEDPIKAKHTATRNKDIERLAQQYISEGHDPIPAMKFARGNKIPPPIESVLKIGYPMKYYGTELNP